MTAQREPSIPQGAPSTIELALVAMLREAARTRAEQEAKKKGAA